MGILEEISFNLDIKKLQQEGPWAIGHEFGHNIQWMTGKFVIG